MNHIDPDGAAIEPAPSSSARLADSSLEGREGVPERTAPAALAIAAIPTLVVAANAEWFRIDDGPLVPLETRLALRKLLLALAALRVRGGVAALSSNQAFAAGWPGERAHPNAASVRVYTAIHTLRALGLRGILVRRNGGYVLEAHVRIAANESQFPGAMTAEEEALASNTG